MFDRVEAPKARWAIGQIVAVSWLIRRDDIMGNEKGWKYQHHIAEQAEWTPGLRKILNIVI